MRESAHDVVIVGAGPVGLPLARLLGLRGHSVLVLGRWPAPYPLPRAVHFDDEIGRIFGSMGLADEVRAVSEAVPDHYIFGAVTDIAHCAALADQFNGSLSAVTTPV